MSPSEVRSSEDAKAIVIERGLEFVKVGVFDMDGVLRGKYISRDKFLSSLETKDGGASGAPTGFGFCDVVLGWDSNDTLYDNVSITGWHTAFPDASVRVIPSTCRELPFENTLFFLGEFQGDATAIDPRSILRRVIERASGLGYNVSAAFEYEFFVFDETPESVREKGFRNLKPFTPGSFGYSVIRNSVHAELYRDLLEMMQRMRIPIEGLHTETGPGVLEAAITVDEALESADRAALFKTFLKVLMQRRDLMVTFMAKWSKQYAGQSGHIHISLSEQGKSSFYDKASPNGISETMRHFIGGQQRLMPELLAMVSSTVNSYTRLIPGFWAPTGATWGIDNRTTALRVIGNSPKSQRVEYRIAAADANPYLALAAALGAGIWGIENSVEPEAAIHGNAYDHNVPDDLLLPHTLWEAAQRLKASEAARALFGNDFVAHYSATREWEEREFRKHITDWELERYFEII